MSDEKYKTKQDPDSPLRFEDADPADNAPATSGQFGPKSGGKFREKSNVRPPSERLQHGDAPPVGGTDRQARRMERSAYRAERTGAKLEKATEKRNKQKPQKNPGPIKSVRRAAQYELYRYAHGKIHQNERENVGVEAAHRTEMTAERGVRATGRFIKRRNRTRPTRRVQKWTKRDIKAKADLQYRKLAQEHPALKKNAVSRFIQKQRLKKRYQRQAQAAAKKGAKAAKKTAVTTEKIAVSVVKYVAVRPHIWLIAGIVILLIVVLQSCMGMFAGLGGSGAGAVGGTAGSADEIYTRFETELQYSIDTMETAHPGYDEYRRNIGPIAHNSAELLGFLLVCDPFPEAEMENVLRDVFDGQYTLTTREVIETRTETATVQSGEPIGEVRTTAYCACEICCGPYADGITASGTTAAVNRTIAVDAYDPIVPMGTQVFINDVAYTVEDTGNLAANNTDFDIYFATHAEAMAWGRQTVTAYLAEDGEVTTTTEHRVLEITLTVKPFAEAVATRLTPEQLAQFNQYDYTQ